MANHVTSIATVENCLQRAAEAAQLAAETNLPNVRDRHLAAERVWRTMADRADEIRGASAIRDEVKAARAI